MQPCLTAVVPCYNEVGTIETLLDLVLASPFIAEVIVVDDGSTDGTRELLASSSDPRVKVLLQPFNQGKGAALRRGFGAATSDYVVIQDADLEYNPADYARLLEPLLAGKADVVYGTRFSAAGPHRVLYYWHSVGNRLLTMASNMATNLNLTDMETCYKVFRREVLTSLELREDRFGFEPEVTARVAAGGWRVYEVGISYDGRTYAEGKKVGWRDGLRAIYCIGRFSPPARKLEGRILKRKLPESGVPHALADLTEITKPRDGLGHYADWLAGLVTPWLGERVVEIGAGRGNVTERLARRGTGSLVATDASPQAVAVLERRFANTPANHCDVVVDLADVETAAARHPADTYVLMNVLEHLADDVAALRHLRDALATDGRIVLFVPAFEALFSRFDAELGHERRYSRDSLRHVLSDACLAPERLHYVNAAGAPGWYLFARLLGQDPTAGRAARLFDRWLVPLMRRVERRVDPPFGQSLFCVARPA